MRTIEHPHTWKEVTPLGEQECTFCHRKKAYFCTVQEELFSLPRNEHEQLILLIRRKFKQFKLKYGYEK